LKNKIQQIFILFSISILLTSTSCEKDDFCIQNPVTSNLIIRFYDDANRLTLKRVNPIFVWAQNKDTISNFNGSSIDSLFIPLNSLASETVYYIAKGTDVDTLTIKYTTKEEYVSRSCGFRVLYNDVSFSINNSSWIKNLSTEIITTIDNQNAAHVQIFH